MLEESTRTQDPKLRTAAGSAVVAGGALAAAKVVRDPKGRQREKPDPYRFYAGEAPRDGVRRIATGQLDLTISLLEDASRDDDSAEAVHDARKALKRLRALLRLSRGAIGERRYRHENLILRDAGRELSGTRDAQVLLDSLDALSGCYAEALREGTWARLRDSLAVAAEQSQLSASDLASSLPTVLCDARERIRTWRLHQNGGPESLVGGFVRVYRRGRRARAAAGSRPNPENLHELRKRAKDLWHAAQLLKPVRADQMDQLRRDAHRLSDLLGEDHDLTILREHAARHPDLLTTVELELLIALIGCRQEALQGEAMSCAAELYQEKPKQLLQRLTLA